MDRSVVEKYALDKVVLLGIFVLGLLGAWVLVTARAAVPLRSVKLAHSGLVVMIPDGKGWKSEGKWIFEDNAYTTGSVFSLDSGRAALSVDVQYLLAPLKITAEASIQEHTQSLAGSIVKTGKLTAGRVVMDWAQIEVPRQSVAAFWAVGELPDGRRLTVEVQAVAAEADWARRIFESVVKAVRFEKDPLLTRGTEIVTELRRRGLAALMKSRSGRHFYLITDAHSQTKGFMADVISLTVDSQGRPKLRTGDIYQVRERDGFYGVHSLFESDSNLNSFLWVSRGNLGGDAKDITIDLELTEQRVLNVRTYTPERPLSYSISPAAIPEIFLEPVFEVFFERGAGPAVVDLILFDGRIVPTLISKLEEKKLSGTRSPAAYALKLDFLDGRGYYDRIYLDEKMEAFRAVRQHDTEYIVERTDEQRLLDIFPLWRDYLREMHRQVDNGKRQLRRAAENEGGVI